MELTPFAGYGFGGGFEDNATYELFYSLQRTKLEEGGLLVGDTLLDAGTSYGFSWTPRQAPRGFGMQNQTVMVNCPHESSVVLFLFPHRVVFPIMKNGSRRNLRKKKKATLRRKEGEGGRGIGNNGYSP